MLYLFELLKLKCPALTPENTKIHLALEDGKSALDLFRDGCFEKFQSWQSQKNFSRKFVVALTPVPNASNTWVFLGAYQVLGKPEFISETMSYHYQFDEIKALSDLEGRIIIGYKRHFRQSYPNAETIADNLIIKEISEYPFHYNLPMRNIYYRRSEDKE
ncbi:hypothetical protein A6A19_05060 [Actinobacillus delphinicola]|uniref:hypothetical protein n=1 Tax=Actinobacillus delphinicola TaxID=51161 RepID=UPI002442EEA1|nr:hypothetical protein [Actinobacillus delphinicola]MDG6897373.1 hypothetical protein [Actinobacillus delphinicola]